MVNSTNIPDVDFDVGEAYAGLMPITEDPNEERQFFFWYSVSPNSLAQDEILIWLNVCNHLPIAACNCVFIIVAESFFYREGQGQAHLRGFFKKTVLSYGNSAHSNLCKIPGRG